MSFALTILAGGMIALLGVVGLWRGVQRGFLSIVGTLLGVILVQLWGATWAAWLEERLSLAPSTAGWMASTLAFLLVVVFVGYGSGSLVRRPKPPVEKDKRPPNHPLSRPAGSLLGVLNGALVASVLLLYTREWSANESLQGAITESFLLTLLIDWFPWFVLGITLLIGVQALSKWVIFVAGRLLTPRPQPAPQPQKAQPQPAAAAAAAAPLTAEQQRIAAQNDAEQRARMQRLAEKVNQKVDELPPERRP